MDRNLAFFLKISVLRLTPRVSCSLKQGERGVDDVDTRLLVGEHYGRGCLFPGLVSVVEPRHGVPC